MDLYFSPLACSLATRIALYEAGAEANYFEVDPKTKVIQNDGSDFRTVNPLGLVPTLRTDDGLILTENAAILQYVADRFPQAGIASGPGNSVQKLSASRYVRSSSHFFSSTRILCIKAICPAGPPNEVKPMRVHTLSASAKAAGGCAVSIVTLCCPSVV